MTDLVQQRVGPLMFMYQDCGTCIEREGDFISKHMNVLILPTHILVAVSTCVVWVGSLVGRGEKGTVVVIPSVF